VSHQRGPGLAALFALCALVALVACGATRPEVEPPISPSASATTVRSFLATPEPRASGTVVDLVDGDTLVLSVDGSEVRVRLLSIDTPEADLDQCFAGAATSFVTAVAPPGAQLELEQDVTDVDPFGRLLRYAYLPDGSMLNEQLVRGGFARVAPEGPDRRYLERLRDAEAIARRQGVGIWGECGTPTPAAIVSTATPIATAAIVPTHTSTPTPTPTPTPTGTPIPSPPTATPTPTAVPSPLPTATATASPTATATPTPTPTPAPTAAPTPAPTVTPTAPPTNCDPSYPTVCIPPAPPDLDCGDIPFRRFQVLPPDPHRFDGDKDGIGCES
jgi:endonuclease YncB( thermonuclease family)